MQPIKVLFITDTNPGKKSLDRLAKISDKLGISLSGLMLTNTKKNDVKLKHIDKYNMDQIQNYQLFAGFKVVAIGSIASNCATKWKIPHYSFPKLGSSKNSDIDKHIELCYDWLRPDIALEVNEDA